MIQPFSSEFSVQDIISHAANTNEYLSALHDKTPQATLNATLSKLVAMVSPVYVDDIVHGVMNDAYLSGSLHHLHGQLSECEYQLEIFWANKIIDEQLDYNHYPYIANYKAIVDAERSALERLIVLKNQRVCFVGSGPMPITAFELKRLYPHIEMTCVEMEKTALELAQNVAHVSSVDVNHVQICAQHLNYADYDIVFVASMTKPKKDVLQRIADTAKPGTIVAVRTVEQLRHILYEAVTEDMIPATFEYCDKTEYHPTHVNTGLFYRVK